VQLHYLRALPHHGRMRLHMVVGRRRRWRRRRLCGGTGGIALRGRRLGVVQQASVSARGAQVVPLAQTASSGASTRTLARTKRRFRFSILDTLILKPIRRSAAEQSSPPATSSGGGSWEKEQESLWGWGARLRRRVAEGAEAGAGSEEAAPEVEEAVGGGGRRTAATRHGHNPACPLSVFHLLHPSSTCNALWQSALVLHPSPKSRTEEEEKVLPEPRQNHLSKTARNKSVKRK
jgi:hypothetical protein